jgi:branched-chain amino acid transport system substrate-binding protein
MFLDDLVMGTRHRIDDLAGSTDRSTSMKNAILSVATVFAVLLSATATAQINVKLGVLTDMSGPYSDLSGPGSLAAAKMAIEDFNPAANGMNVSLVSADHQNKPDIAASRARSWIDVDKVDAIFDVPCSACSLTVADVVASKNKVLFVSGGAAEALTGKSCRPTTVHWTYDTWPLSRGVAQSIVQQGGDSWFFITGDFATGAALEADTASVVTANGGRILGSVRAPLSSSDFASYLVQAQASKAKVIGLAITGNDLVTALKQGQEFGIVQRGQNFAGLITFISEIHGLGLNTAQGLLLVTGFYWDQNEATRSFAQRFAALNRGRHPTMVQAGVYSSVLQYLRAVKTSGQASDGTKVVNTLKASEIDDKLFGKVKVRPNGRAIHDMYLVEVKKPSESKKPWDYYHIRAVIPAEKAFRPLAESGCNLK